MAFNDSLDLLLGPNAGAKLSFKRPIWMATLLHALPKGRGNPHFPTTIFD
jgi:hypothetical protein